MFALHGGQGPGWQSSTHLWTHLAVAALSPPPSLLSASAFLSCLPQTSPQECGVSRRFHSGSLTLRQKQRYCMARSVVGEGFRQPGQTQLLSPDNPAMKI